MAINKVVYNTKDGEQVLMDLTGDTVTPETLAVGATAHDASGKVISGILSPEDGRSILFYDQIPQGNALGFSDFNATPKVGDLVIDENCDLWEVLSIQGTTALCKKLGNIKGAKGEQGERGEKGEEGEQGLSIYTTNSHFATDPDGEYAEVHANNVNIPDGRTLKVGDLIIGNARYLCVVTEIGTTAYCRVIGDLKGDNYTLTSADKTEIATIVKNSFSNETWTFTLADGSTVTKKMVLA